jgi:HAD superfamily hydrolase (TIGR01509 family)
LSLEAWASAIGAGRDTFHAEVWLERCLGKPVAPEPLWAAQERREMELVKGLRPLPGVEEMLSEARALGLKLAVASSSDRAWVSGHLDRLGLESYFQALVTADDVRRLKPDPEIYLRALATLEVEPEEAMALEDSPNGVLAARRAGIPCVAVPNAVTARLHIEGASLMLESLAGVSLESLLARVDRGHEPSQITSSSYMAMFWSAVNRGMPSI